MSRWIAAAVVAAVATGLTGLGSAYALKLATLFAMYATLATSWNVIGGMTGYPSFATAAFFGLGAYAGALAQSAGVPMPLAWVWAGIVAGAVALAAGWLVLPLRGHYFAIASLAILIILRTAATNWTDLTGGGMGLNLPIPSFGALAQARIFFAGQACVAAVAVGSAYAVSVSRLGFGLRCIKQNETAAGMLGLNTSRTKTAAFVLSAAMAGPAGAVYASTVSYIEPGDVFDVLLTVEPIIMTMLGGAGTVFGPVLGALIFVVLEQTVWAKFVSIHAAVLGGLIIMLALALPDGLLGWRRRA